MEGHPVDRFLFRFGLVTVLLLSGVSFYILTQDVTCSWPEHFFRRNEGYATKACSRKNGQWYQVSDDIVVRPHERIIGANTITIPYFKIQLLFTLEVVTLVVSYVLLSNIMYGMVADARGLERLWRRSCVASSVEGATGDAALVSRLTSLLHSRGAALLYILFQLFAIITWFACGVYSYVLGQDDVIQGQITTVMCDFDTNEARTIQQYHVRCQLPDLQWMYFALVANTTLCFLTAAIILLHSIHTFVIAPQFQVAGIQATLGQKAYVGCSYGITNLYMVFMASNNAHLSVYSPQS